MKNIVLYFVGAILAASTGWAQDSGTSVLELSAEEIATGYASPTVITHAGDERIFVVRQPGIIEIMYRDGSKEPEPFLDITDRVIDQGSEEGLLGLTFPPDYCTSGYFYVNYTHRGMGEDSTRVSRFSVDDTNPNEGDPDSEEVLMQFSQPYSNHNGGHIEFGSDGMLYIGSGDGGSGGDPENNAQDIMEYLGKLLRIDVSEAPGYAIPDDNPYAFVDYGLDEIWDYGLRNPWKFAFDSETGDLYIADVGQNAWEEVNYEAADSEGGVNYGWRCYEGTHEYNLSECEAPEYTMPVFEYPHSGDGQSRCSVTGGRVYRGPSYEDMDGKYFFTDLCSGEFWSMASVGGEWTTENHGTIGVSSVTTFGSDVWGEMYFATGSGAIYRLDDANDELVAPIVLGPDDSLMSTLAGQSYEWFYNGAPMETTGPSVAVVGNGTYSLTITTSTGCQIDAGDIEITHVNTEDFARVGTLELYPNPVTDARFVVDVDMKLSGIASLEIYSVSGERIFSTRAVRGENVLDLADVSTGLYIVKLLDGDRMVAVGKFIKHE